MTTFRTAAIAAAIAVMGLSSPVMAAGIDHLDPHITARQSADFGTGPVTSRDLHCREMNTSVTAGHPTANATQCTVYDYSLSGNPVHGGISQYK